MCEQRTTFPQHGKIGCSVCFPNGCAERHFGEWRFRNDPGHWGSSTPRVLVLGFSKGAIQADAYANRHFDDVAFAGCRDRLKIILVEMGIVGERDDFEKRFKPTETLLAFASLVRCSLAMLDPKTHGYSTSGAIVVKAFRRSETRRIIQNCANQFLRRLPCELKLVLMLGIQDAYICECRRLIGSIHEENFHAINEVAYSASKVIWVHVTHPSRGNGHFDEWLAGDPSLTKIARKRVLAKQTIHGISGL